jgi:hypothetical protein
MYNPIKLKFFLFTSPILSYDDYFTVTKLVSYLLRTPLLQEQPIYQASIKLSP